MPEVRLPDGSTRDLPPDASAADLAAAIEFVHHQLEAIGRERPALPEGRGALAQAMTNLCQALLVSNEFLYVE